MKVQIFKYKVNKSMKRLLLVGNGCPSSVFAIQLDRTFKAEDAEEIAKKVNSGQF